MFPGDGGTVNGLRQDFHRRKLNWSPGSNNSSSRLVPYLHATVGAASTCLFRPWFSRLDGPIINPDTLDRHRLILKHDANTDQHTHTHTHTHRA